MDRRKFKERLYNLSYSPTCRTTPPRPESGAGPRRTGGWCCLPPRQRCPHHLEWGEYYHLCSTWSTIMNVNISTLAWGMIHLFPLLRNKYNLPEISFV